MYNTPSEIRDMLHKGEGGSKTSEEEQAEEVEEENPYDSAELINEVFNYINHDVQTNNNNNN